MLTPIKGFPERAILTEVGPRDGLQSEPVFVPTERKIELVHALIGAGLRRFEITSFVSPRAVPQMRDAAQVLAAFRGRDDLHLTALVPNVRGAEAAIEAGADALVLFASASESHNLKNVNRSRADSLAGFAEIARLAEGSGTALQGAIATAFGCPFEGNVAIEAVVDQAKAYRDLGMGYITLGDTTGMATPANVIELVQALRPVLEGVDLALHFHNTRGVGLACAYAGLSLGVTHFESSIGGLGGCPFVPRATGNIATEDLAYMLEESGVQTDLDLERLISAAELAEELVGRELPGQVMKAGPRLKTAAMDSVRTANG
ncbi:hydroxymethylglutaryl-CoA lyase [Paracoccus seriniphilus]|uniref:Hydroxymethylglutaryl-CoA lyase n=1 Tax=Paracoccus seriniphilus TaxID=184748 RepID=A0A239Q0P2_9RHOB|nr:hydroxymethylglutaryl-CoA lyase [Paracoccus seriniphilus]WCR16316.1 hydroxymethylglutaryl-CoA lyase [Paracoccus seriniphilus]SNT75823.1 hydroxymethylglutaryl-CoA lyase [Paracoccus seriniphilus]